MLAKILREVVAAERPESYADAMEAWKIRLAALRIAWQPDDLHAALALVESNTAIVARPPKPGRTRHHEAPVDECRPFTAGEARTLVARLQRALKREADRGRHGAVAVSIGTLPGPRPPLTRDDVNDFRRAHGLWRRQETHA